MKILFKKTYKRIFSINFCSNHYINSIDKVIKFIFRMNNWSKIFLLLLLAINEIWAGELTSLSTRYCNIFTQIFLFDQSTTSACLWARLSYSSITLYIVGISAGDKFSLCWSFLPQQQTDWLSSYSHLVRFCTIWKVFLLFPWKHWFLHPRGWIRFWSKKNVRICINNFENPHSWCNFDCPRKQ